MSPARIAFVGRLRSVDEILADQISIDKSPAPQPDSAAVTVRNGVTVMLFCALEAFVRDRSLECAKTLIARQAQLSRMPQAMIEAALVRQFEVLGNRPRLKGQDKLNAYSAHISEASKTASGSSLGVHETAFSPKRSNFSHDEVNEIAKMFGAIELWREADAFLALASVSIPQGSSSAAFKSVSDARHECAHKAAHVVSHPNAALYRNLVSAVALAFDAIVSLGTKKLMSASPPPSGGSTISSPWTFATVNQNGKSMFSTKLHGSARAVSRRQTVELCLDDAVPHLERRTQVAVHRSRAGQILDWRTCCP